MKYLSFSIFFLSYFYSVSQIIVNETFGDPFNDGWYTTGTGSSGGTITSSQLWLHDFDGPNGHFSNFTSIINSQTVNDGFMILDADFANGNGGPPTVIETFQAELASPEYDLTGQPDVQLKFTHQYRLCCITPNIPQLWVEVSTNGFATVSASYVVTYADAPTNVSSGTRTHTLDISNAILGNPATTSIRFRWGTLGSSNNSSHYYWQIDDMIVRVTPDHELGITNSGLVHETTSSFLGVKKAYTKVPNEHWDQVNLFGAYTNTGQVTQTGASINVKIKNSSLATVFDQNTPAQTIIAHDTISDTTITSWLPSVQDQYAIYFDLNYVNEGLDDDPSNNFGDTLYYEATDFEYACDNLDHETNFGVGYSQLNSGATWMGVGNMFQIMQNDTLHYVKFAVSQYYFGANYEVIPFIYRVDPGFPNSMEILYEFQSSFTIDDSASQITTDINDIKWLNAPIGDGLPLVAGEEYFIGVISGDTPNQYSSIISKSFSTSLEGGFIVSKTGGSIDGIYPQYRAPAIRAIFKKAINSSASMDSPISCNGVCDGAMSVTANSLTGASLSHQWYLNGDSLPGATSISLSNACGGTYTIKTEDSDGYSVWDTIVLIEPAVIIPIVTTSGSIIGCVGGSVQLDATLGFSTYLWSNGSGSNSITVTQSGDYWVTVSDVNGCQGNSVVHTVNASNQMIPELCIVGLDTVANLNRVVWEKPITSAIDSFYVYRETNQANVYTKIGATDYSDLALWIDQGSNPNQQSYRYKISLLDSCDVESGMSDFHQTFHLVSTQGTGQVFQLDWTNYIGVTYGSVNIYRGTSPTNLTLLATVPNVPNSYTDNSAPVGPVYYQVEVFLPQGCDPTKAGYQTIRSNITQYGVANIVENAEPHFVKIYPNPTTGKFKVKHDGKAEIEIYDFTGRKIQEVKSDGEITLDLGMHDAGVYFIRIGNQSYRVIKN